MSLLTPLLLEAALVAAAIVLVLPWFGALALQDTGRGARFADAPVAVRGLPLPILDDMCALFGTRAEDVVRERLCRRVHTVSAGERVERMPGTLVSAYGRVRQAFATPLQEAEARLSELRVQQREGAGDLLAVGNAIEAGEAEIQPFVERYALNGGATDGPRPLACAFASVRAAIAAPGSRADAGHDMQRANAVLLLAGALDGNGAVGGVAATATLPVMRSASPQCAGIEPVDAFASAASIMADARAAPIALAKNDAMRRLLQTAGWQWAAAAIAALALVNLSRRRVSAAIGIALALATWALAAWIARVPWPFASEHAFVLGRQGNSLLALPAPFVLVLLGIAVALLAAAPWLRGALAKAPQAPASVLTYPGLVLATGVGWMLLLDLSANGHWSNRYLALYHQGHLWLGMLTFTVVAFLRQPLGRALAWILALLDGAASRAGSRIGGIGGAVLLLVLTIALTVAIGTLLLNVRQLTSEIGRLWLVGGAAWFFFMRGTPLAERLAGDGSSMASLLRYIWPLLFVVIVLVGAMLITRDMGPLLIAAYGSGALLAASIAMWGYQRNRAKAAAYAVAVLLFATWIGATTFALFKFGAIDEVTAGRLENAAAPLASANDHLALVTWFQRAAPPAGFGPGAVPWCGLAGSRACSGVPAQIQSDYTFTALVGMFGWTAAWALTLGCVVWLHGAVLRHGAVTRGEPRLVRIAGRLGNDGQAFVSWLCVTWVALALCQLSVTVAGNLGVIPLTGVTFPFVSFGMTSLVVNMAMLALAVDVNAGQGIERG